MELEFAPLGTFHLFKSGSNRLWYFHLKANNGKVIAASEGYHNRDDVVDLYDTYFGTFEFKEDEDVADR